MSGKTLYLRGLSEEVVRDAKVEAARRGVTLARFVADAIEQTVRSSHGPLDTLPDVLAEDREWYEDNKARLLKRYEGEYLAIIDRKVVDHDADFSDLSKRVFAEVGPRPVLMPHCVAGEEIVRVRGPRARNA